MARALPGPILSRGGTHFDLDDLRHRTRRHRGAASTGALEYELANQAFLELVGAGDDPMAARSRRRTRRSPARSRRRWWTSRAPVGRSRRRTCHIPTGGRVSSGRWATFQVRALPDEAGRGRAVLLVAHDTTGAVIARVRAEALAGDRSVRGQRRRSPSLLQRAAAKARELLGAARAFVLLADAAPGRFRGTVEVGDGLRRGHRGRGGPPRRLAGRRSPGAGRVRAGRGRRSRGGVAPGGGSGERALCAAADARRPLGLLYLTWTTGAPPPAADVAFASKIGGGVLAHRPARPHPPTRAGGPPRIAPRDGAAGAARGERSAPRRRGGLAPRWCGPRPSSRSGTSPTWRFSISSRRTAFSAGRPWCTRRSPRAVLRSGRGSRRGGEPGDRRDALVTRRTRHIVLHGRETAGEADDPDLVALDALGAASCIVAPLVIRRRPAGVLTLVRRSPSPPHEHEDVVLATEIAHRAAIALDDARLLAAAADEAAARDAFLAAAAHDLRSPLTALRLQVETLGRSAASPPAGGTGSSACGARWTASRVGSSRCSTPHARSLAARRSSASR